MVDYDGKNDNDWRLDVKKDSVIIPGYVREASGAAGGFRVRGGTNLVIADTLGLTINLSTGFWRGKDFDQVQLGLNESGFVPHLSAGTVFYF